VKEPSVMISIFVPENVNFPETDRYFITLMMTMQLFGDMGSEFGVTPLNLLFGGIGLYTYNFPLT